MASEVRCEKILTHTGGIYKTPDVYSYDSIMYVLQMLKIDSKYGCQMLRRNKNIKFSKDASDFSVTVVMVMFLPLA